MSEVEIPIGPQHPALKEPVNFRVFVDGERVVRLDLDVSYNHRGIEKAAEARDFPKALYLIERICGICSHAHATNFVKGIETIMGVTVPRRARYLRVIVGELERIHSHLLWLGVAAHEIGFNTLFMYTWRDREIVQDILEAISGNRVNYGVNTLGGVRRDLTDGLRARILEDVRTLEARSRYYLDVLTQEETFLVRTRRVGFLSRERAEALGAVGPTARASGIPFDIRRVDPYEAYEELPVEVITASTCDVFGRTVVRAREISESLRIIREAVENLPGGPISVPAPRAAPKDEVVSRYEAPRGELIHYIRTNGTDKVDRLDARTPTLANWPSVVDAMVGHYLADIPVVVSAIDPCLSCTSRITVCDLGDRTKSVLTWDDLRDHGIRFYRERRGV